MVHDCRGFIQSMATWICWIQTMVKQDTRQGTTAEGIYGGTNQTEGGGRNKIGALHNHGLDGLFPANRSTTKISHCFQIMLTMF